MLVNGDKANKVGMISIPDIDWTKTHPTAVTPVTWQSNMKILAAIKAMQAPDKMSVHGDSREVSFCFGSDIDFDQGSILPKDTPLLLARLEKALGDYAKNGGDSTWAETLKNEIATFSVHYLAMLELHGLQDPEGNWLMKGELSDITEYRYGRAREGIGWRDEPRTLEIRTKPLEPLEFIAAYNQLMHALKVRGAHTVHIHLHVSVWGGGKPFEPGARNIFENETGEDLQKSKAAVAALTYAAGEGRRASPQRSNGIRTAKGRMELRHLETAPEKLHMARSVLETMCNIKYGFTHPEAEHLPEVTTGWRPHFSFPDNPLLQIEFNQATLYDDSHMGPLNDLFALSRIDPNEFRKPYPLCNDLSVYAERMDNGKVIITIPPLKEDRGKEFDDARKKLEQLLNDSTPIAVTTLSTEIISSGSPRLAHQTFERNPAHQEFMPPQLYTDIANSLRRQDGIPALRPAKTLS